MTLSQAIRRLGRNLLNLLGNSSAPGKAKPKRADQ
jgi:hypothetical protein